MTTPEAYLRSQPEPHRRALQVLRDAIVATAPDCVETVRRRVPAYLLDGRPLVSIGAARRHVSLYVMYGEALERLADRLAELDVSTTVVRFDPARPVPVDVVAEIVRFRAGEVRPPPNRLPDPGAGRVSGRQVRGDGVRGRGG